MSIRIGTRRSPLALWQAEQVKDFLDSQTVNSTIIPIDSQGDKNLIQPLYAMGVQGIFTKNLDIALLNDKADLAVHSLKDVPTELPKGIELTTYLQRASPWDVLIHRTGFFEKEKRQIASGSLRRQAYWKNRFPEDKIQDLRGNIDTRINKLLTQNLDGIIMAEAALHRLEIQQKLKDLDLNFTPLHWMTPAPAQGCVAVAATKKFPELKLLNHAETEKCVQIERLCLNLLKGGCTAPIGVFAEIKEDKIQCLAEALSLDGTIKLKAENLFKLTENIESIAKSLVDNLFNQGAERLIEKNKKEIAELNG